MDGIEKLADIPWPVFVALVLPGFISMRVFSLLHPVDAAPLKDSVLEAIAFSVLNAAAFLWALPLAYELTNPWVQYGLILLVFAIAPALWPFLVRYALRVLSRSGIILRPYKNSWDAYFLRGEPCWLIVHLKDGRKIGGYFGSHSFASLHPHSGHLYVEAVWQIDQSTGEFQTAVPGSEGLLLRPDDYHFVELKK